MIDVFVEKNYETAMRSQGISTPKIIITVLVFVVFLVLIYTFVFVGFAAFTDPTATVDGVLNTFIVILIAFAAQQIVAKEADDEDVREHVDNAEQKVFAQLEKVIEMVRSQVLMAKKLFNQMQR
jgi:hypothetical protein